jgi:NAD(P)H-dependent FMN reductase
VKISFRYEGDQHDLRRRPSANISCVGGRDAVGHDAVGHGEPGGLGRPGTSTGPSVGVTAPKTLLIVQHSMTGGTLQMATAAARGAGTVDGIRVSMLTAAEASASDLLDASAYIFATPENLAAMSGQMKDFFDRTYYAALDRLNGRPYAVLICAGSDGRNAAQQIVRIATGWRLRAVAEPLIVYTHAKTPEDILSPKTLTEEQLSACSDVGATLAAGTELGIF